MRAERSWTTRAIQEKPCPQIIVKMYLFYVYGCLTASVCENHVCAWCPQRLLEVGLRSGMGYRWSLDPLRSANILNYLVCLIETGFTPGLCFCNPHKWSLLIFHIVYNRSLVFQIIPGIDMLVGSHLHEPVVST